MELKTRLKEIADSYGWRFVYARRDYQNLIDATNFISDELRDAGKGETVLFMDPVTRRAENIGTRFTGNFMVLTSSDFDNSYEERMLNYVDPLIRKVMNDMRAQLVCDFDVDDWTAIEVINMFDFNADGLNVRFNLKGY